MSSTTVTRAKAGARTRGRSKARTHRDQIKVLEQKRNELAIRIADALAAGRCEAASKALQPYSVVREELLLLEALVSDGAGHPK